MELLTRTRLGRLACAHDSQPYIAPIYFAYDDGYLYSFATTGKKIEWMQTNPNVCVEVDEVAGPQQWISVVVLGRYEELPNIPERRDAREYARRKLLQHNAIWWEPAYAKTILHDTQRPLAPVFFRIQVLQITGRRATPERLTPGAIKPSMPAPGDNRWLQKILGQFRKQT